MSQLSLFNAVPVRAIEVLTAVDSKLYFKRADLGRYLGIANIRDQFSDIATKSRSELAGPGVVLNYARYGMIGGGLNPHDAFVNLEAALEIVVRSRKPKAVELTKWLTHIGLDKVLEEKQQAIEGKDSAIALLNDDLTDRERQVAVLEQQNLEAQEHSRQLEFENVGLQGEIREKDRQIASLQQRFVPFLSDEKKNYGMTVIAKNDETAEFPFISICGQHGYRRQKKRMVLLKKPGSTEFADADTPNAIVTYNMWRELGLIETAPNRPRDFKLVSMDQDRLLQLQDA